MKGAFNPPQARRGIETPPTLSLVFPRDSLSTRLKLGGALKLRVGESDRVVESFQPASS